MSWKRTVGVGTAVVAVAAGVAYSFVPQPLAVDVVTAERGPLAVTIEEEGKTRVIDRFVISTPVAGFAHRIELEVGDEVDAGQALVELEPLRSTILDPRARARAEAHVEAARAALAAAEENAEAADADATYWKSEVARIRQLYAEKIEAQGRLDQAENEARRSAARKRSANFAVEVANYDLAAAQTELQYSTAEELPTKLEQVTIHAPVAGRVLKVLRESEGVVQPGQALLEVGDPRSLEIEVEVLSADAIRVAPGTRVRLLRWGGPDALEARVRVVEPVGFTKISALGVEEQRVLVIADITSPHAAWQRLGDGYRVEAQFVLWSDEDVLRVPQSALFRDPNGWATFVVDDGVARHRAVEVGHRSGLAAEILSGLEPGETVIPHPVDAVGDGVAVRPR